MKLAAVVPTEENALQGKKGQKREQKEKKSCLALALLFFFPGM